MLSSSVCSFVASTFPAGEGLVTSFPYFARVKFAVVVRAVGADGFKNTNEMSVWGSEVVAPYNDY